MNNIRQIETTSVTFIQYNNGINEIIYQECSRRAVDKLNYFISLVLRETSIDDTVYVLCNLSKLQFHLLVYHFAQIKKVDSLYPPYKRSYIRLASVSPEMKLEHEMYLAYMRSLYISRIKLNMFAIDNYDIAVSWLLSDV